jgi:hypothetical protein
MNEENKVVCLGGIKKFAIVLIDSDYNRNVVAYSM